MAEGDGEDRNFEATSNKLQQARTRGEVPVSREAPAAGVYIAALAGFVVLAAGAARHIAEIVLPMLDHPEAWVEATQQGWDDAGHAVVLALALALVPFFALLASGGLLPYVLQNSIAIAPERIMPKLSHLSPARGFHRIFSGRSLFEFAKSLLKMVVVAVACYFVAKPIYENSVGLVSIDVGAMPGMLLRALMSVMLATTLVAVGVAGIDVPFQHWSFHRRMRMSFEEMRKEMRESQGDPHIRAKRRRVARQRSQRRMIREVPKATVIITNPTHFAVALRYRRGEDTAPVVVAKGADLIAKRIREIAGENDVAIVENPPLARALHATVEIGEVIPHEHFEAVAKIIGLVWAQRAAAIGAPAGGPAGRPIGGPLLPATPR